jgi:Na+-transporting NADH:ubiquinone oxidoreductase subunit F
MTTVLIATGLTLLITSLLAGLLVLAERYIANYGECRIVVNDEAKDLNVTGGETLLNTLRANEIFIPSACGGKGTCAYCKVKVLDGGGPYTPTETPLLSEAEVAEGVRISCQVKVRNDLHIELPAELLFVREYTGVVDQIRDLTHDIKELRIRLVEPDTLDFTSGQYVQLQAPAYGDNPEAVFRAYSVSSDPDESDHIELIVRLVPGGICTTWVFEHLNEGDEVLFTGPFGEFRLSDSDREMVWIAGGSGMAPFWSMLRHMKRHGIVRKTTYFFGAVRPRDMFFVEELRQMERELDWFTFVPALSAPDEVPDDWDGETGLITDVVGRHIEDGSQMEGYLCGSPGMIDASIKVLHDKGITDDRIFYDKFA